MRYTRATLVLKLLPNCYTETSRRELHYSVVYVRRYLSCGELHRFVWEGEDPRNAVRAGLVWWSLAQLFFFQVVRGVWCELSFAAFLSSPP